MKQQTVLITGAGGRSVGYQIISCLKKFPEKYRIIATDRDPFSAGLFMSDKAYVVPTSSDPTYIQTLVKIAKIEKVKAVFPGSQPEVIAIGNAEEALLKNNIISMINKPKLISIFANKDTQYEYLIKKGIRVPKFLVLRGELPQHLPFSFPFILKPTKDHAGSRNVFLIKDKDELETIYSQLQAANIEVLIQEYIGDEEHEYTVGVISDRNGKAYDAIVMKRKLLGLSMLTERKIRKKTYAISTGYSQGFFVNDENIKAYCIKIAKVLESRGPLNIQLRTDKKGVVIFEVHTRFSGSSSQRALVGFNEPDILFRNFVLNEKITPVKKIPEGVVIRYLENIYVPTEKYNALLKKGTSNA